MKLGWQQIVNFFINYFSLRVVVYIVAFYAFYFGKVQDLAYENIKAADYIGKLWSYIFGIGFSEGSLYILKKFK